MKKTIMSIAFAAAVAAASFAHPHMSLVSRLEIEYDGDLCRGFWVDWTFDPYFSASIIQDFDKNGDRKLNEAEIKGVFSGAFSNLRKYGYFTYIRTGSARKSPDAVERFTAEVRGDRLAYRFFIRVDAKGDLNAAIIDTTYFCAVQYPKKDSAVVRQLKAGAPLPSVERVLDTQYPVYYDPSQSSTDNSKHAKWRPGLETAYPEEFRAKL